jgi:hypothetical protein
MGGLPPRRRRFDGLSSLRAPSGIAMVASGTVSDRLWSDRAGPVETKWRGPPVAETHRRAGNPDAELPYDHRRPRQPLSVGPRSRPRTAGIPKIPASTRSKARSGWLSAGSASPVSGVSIARRVAPANQRRLEAERGFPMAVRTDPELRPVRPPARAICVRRRARPLGPASPWRSTSCPRPTRLIHGHRCVRKRNPYTLGIRRHGRGRGPERRHSGRTTCGRREMTSWLKALDASVASHLSGTGHPSGTCEMGPDSDTMAVADQHGRLRGVDGIRVGDTRSVRRSLRRGRTRRQ